MEHHGSGDDIRRDRGSAPPRGEQVGEHLVGEQLKVAESSRLFCEDSAVGWRKETRSHRSRTPDLPRLIVLTAKELVCAGYDRAHGRCADWAGRDTSRRQHYLMPARMRMLKPGDVLDVGYDTGRHLTGTPGGGGLPGNDFCQCVAVSSRVGPCGLDFKRNPPIPGVGSVPVDLLPGPPGAAVSKPRTCCQAPSSGAPNDALLGPRRAPRTPVSGPWRADRDRRWRDWDRSARGRGQANRRPATSCRVVAGGPEWAR